MTTLKCYSEFLTCIEHLGFLPFSHLLSGLPSLSSFTSNTQWHTGDPETDPWRWKDRAAAEKSLAYGCILGGHKGFIAPRLYGLFYLAFHPTPAFIDRWEAGEVNHTTWQVWNLFEKQTILDTGQIRKKLGVTASNGASRVDLSVRELQRDFYLCVTGSRRKIGKNGQEYGWAINTLTRIENWIPNEWLTIPTNLDQVSAREQVLDLGMRSGENLERSELARLFGWPPP
jgi:hypothetical protein